MRDVKGPSKLFQELDERRRGMAKAQLYQSVASGRLGPLSGEACHRNPHTAKKLCRKRYGHLGLVIRTIATRIMLAAKLVTSRQSLDQRRNSPSQANVSSTIQRIGNTANVSLFYSQALQNISLAEGRI